jgi:hypothetical protein
LKVQQLPGSYLATASYNGDSSYLPSSASANLTVTKQTTSLSLSGSVSVQYSDPNQVVATLLDGLGQPLGQKTVVIVGTDGSNQNYSTSARTNNLGQALLEIPRWPGGNYNLKAYFSGTIPGLGDSTDDLYQAAVSAGNPTISFSAEGATLSYLNVGSLLDVISPIMSYQVTQDNDGFPGNLSLAQVQLVVTQGANTISTITNSAGLDGKVVFDLTGLGLVLGGSYTATATLVGGYYSGSPLVTPFTMANCLSLGTHSDNGNQSCGSLSGAIILANQRNNPILTISFSVGATVTITGGSPQLISNTGGNRIVLDGGDCSNNNPVKILSGGGYSGIGLRLGANVTLRCIWITGFSGGGITVKGQGNILENVLVLGNQLGIKILAGGNVKVGPASKSKP